MDRLFLDANTLFSAAYRPGAGVVALWDLDNVLLATSIYARDEAERNLTTPTQKRRLQRLLRSMTLVGSTAMPEELGVTIQLPEKDWPIIAGAIQSGATHLITGDVKHFGRYFGTRIAGLLVVPPAQYLRSVTRTS